MSERAEPPIDEVPARSSEKPASPRDSLAQFLWLIGLAVSPLLISLFIWTDDAGVQPLRRFGAELLFDRTDQPADDAVGQESDGRPVRFRRLSFNDLVPPDWDPASAIGDLDINALKDGDPRADAALREIQTRWRDAPVNTSLDDQDVRIAGYVVPLSGQKHQLREFLLVPFFGACVHVPPPPSNQIIHVVSDKPLLGVRSMDAVRASGRLKTRRSAAPEGDASYGLDLDSIERSQGGP